MLGYKERGKKALVWDSRRKIYSKGYVHFRLHDSIGSNINSLLLIPCQSSHNKDISTLKISCFDSRWRKWNMIYNAIRGIVLSLKSVLIVSHQMEHDMQSICKSCLHVVPHHCHLMNALVFLETLYMPWQYSCILLRPPSSPTLCSRFLWNKYRSCCLRDMLHDFLLIAHESQCHPSYSATSGRSVRSTPYSSC